MRVVEAKFREAKPYEIEEDKGKSYLWHALRNLCDLTMKVWGTCEIAYQGPNPISWRTPLPLAVTHAIKLYLGYAPERSFMREFPSFIRHWHFIEAEPKVFEAFFKEHRNGELFELTESLKMAREMVSKAFPDTKFTNDDFIFSCAPEKSAFFRNLFHTVFDKVHIGKFIPMLQEEAKTCLERWTEFCRVHSKPLNASFETRRFASEIICRLILGQKPDNRLPISVHYINSYITKRLTRNTTQDDERVFKNAMILFHKCVLEILEEKNVPLFEAKEEKKMTQEQKIGMVFATFFAGQETVASLLVYILRKLALNPELFQTLQKDYDERKKLSIESTTEHSKKIQDLFFQSLCEFPAAYGVGRILKKPVCLKYKLEGESDSRKMIMYEGESIKAMMYKAAEKIQITDPSSAVQRLNLFGGGPHHCPGRKFAEAEVIAFVTELVANYQLQIHEVHPPKKISHVTLQYDQEIFITVTRR
jgi:cytochrome P450